MYWAMQKWTNKSLSGVGVHHNNVDIIHTWSSQYSILKTETQDEIPKVRLK